MLIKTSVEMLFIHFIANVQVSGVLFRLYYFLPFACSTQTYICKDFCKHIPYGHINQWHSTDVIQSEATSILINRALSSKRHCFVQIAC